jgi:glucose/arabinose dehydrogenase
MKFASQLVLALAALAAVPAIAQTAPAAQPTTPAVAPAAAAPTAAPAAAPAAAKPAMKKRTSYRKGKPKAVCTKLDDPWDNVCAIKKKAEVACKDQPTGKKVRVKEGKRTKWVKGENKRAACIDAYMKNV